MACTGGRGAAWRGADHENKCEEWNNTNSPSSHSPNASCQIVKLWWQQMDSKEIFWRGVTTLHWEEHVMLLATKLKLVTENVHCLKWSPSLPSCLGTAKKEVPWKTHLHLDWQDRPRNSAAVLTAGRQVLNEQVQTVWTVKVTDFHYVQPKQKFFILL